MFYVNPKKLGRLVENFKVVIEKAVKKYSIKPFCETED